MLQAAASNVPALDQIGDVRTRIAVSLERLTYGAERRYACGNERPSQSAKRVGPRRGWSPGVRL
jgi:hypothetical protein